MNHAHKTAVKIALLSLIAMLVGAAISYYVAQRVYTEKQEVEKQEPQDLIGNTTTTTPEQVKDDSTNEKKYIKENTKTTYSQQPIYTEPTTPPITNNHIEINTITKENNGTINNTVQPRNEPVTNPTQAFTPPREMTPTEIGHDILNIYKLTGTVEHLDNGKLRVTLSTGQQVVQDLVDGWEEKLKLTINRIK